MESHSWPLAAVFSSMMYTSDDRLPGGSCYINLVKPGAQTKLDSFRTPCFFFLSVCSSLT